MHTRESARARTADTRSAKTPPKDYIRQTAALNALDMQLCIRDAFASSARRRNVKSMYLDLEYRREIRFDPIQFCLKFWRGNNTFNFFARQIWDF